MSYFNFDTELKNVISTLVGDIYVDVNIQFKPRAHTNDMETGLALDSVNARLASLGGELQYEIKQMLKAKLSNQSPTGE